MCMLSCIAAGALVTVCGTPHREGPAFYVSPAGDDSYSGRASNPFATLARARDAIRELKEKGGLTEPVTVFLRGGTYHLTEPFVLTPVDSGTDSCPITYTAEPGETAVVSGGRTVSGWKAGERGLWTAMLPEVASGSWYFTSLYVNGEPRPRTRLPEEGYYIVEDFEGKDREPWAAPSRQFTYGEGDIKADWRNLSDVEVVVLRFWVSSRQHISEVDESARRVSFREETRYRYSDDFTREGARYFVENVFEALDTPGEWYLDRPAGILYYYPKPGEDMNAVEVTAPVSPYLVRIEGESLSQRVAHVNFRGLTFTHNNWQLPDGNPGDGQSAPAVEGAVYLRGAEHCSFEDCRLVQLSSYAFEIDEGCRDNLFCGNELGHLEGGGFRIGGGGADAHPDLRTGWNIIADNHIHHIGERYHAATGIFIQHSGGNTITHNEIDHTYYSSIAIGWVWGYRPSVSSHNEISFNHIHHVGQGVLSDMGGIYLLGVAPGTVVRNNLIHDVESHGYGGWGIYTDEGSTHVLIENNIVHHTKFAGFNQHYGRENIVRNNIFALGKEAQISRGRVEEHVSFFLERNIVFWKNDAPLLAGNWEFRTYMHRPGAPWADAEPDSATYMFDYNLYYNPDRPVENIRFAQWTFDLWQAHGQDRHGRYADPGFADPDEGDFTLHPGSPALELGFRPIDMSTVGPRKR